jgi:hypothetical protein
MAVTVSQLVTRVEALCRPVSSVLTADVQAALAAIVPTLSSMSPQKKAVSLTLSDGAGDLSTLTGWVDGTSEVTAVEYPLDEVPRDILHPALWDQRFDNTLALINGTSEVVRVYFTAEHAVNTTADTTTFSATEGEAAAHLAAAQVLESLASRWGQAQSVSVAGDEYTGPSPATIEASAGAFRDRAEALLVRPAVLIGYEPTGYDFVPDPF